MGATPLGSFVDLRWRVYDAPMAGIGVVQPPPALIGRERECAAIDGLLDRALIGEAGALVVRGEAGIGKSALLAYACDRIGDGRRRTA
jgi:hypothetical protein